LPIWHQVFNPFYYRKYLFVLNKKITLQYNLSDLSLKLYCKRNIGKTFMDCQFLWIENDISIMLIGTMGRSLSVRVCVRLVLEIMWVQQTASPRANHGTHLTCRVCSSDTMARPPNRLYHYVITRTYNPPFKLNMCNYRPILLVGITKLCSVSSS
jgi:hypothetical protein